MENSHRFEAWFECLDGRHRCRHHSGRLQTQLLFVVVVASNPNRSWKPEYPQGYPGFESLSLRFDSRSKTQRLSQKPRVLSGFLCIYGPNFCLSRFALCRAEPCSPMQIPASRSAPIRAPRIVVVTATFGWRSDSSQFQKEWLASMLV